MKQLRWRALAIAMLACAAWSASTFYAQDPADLASRRCPPAKLPTFVSPAPLYGLFLFGRDADVRVWAVLDRSTPEIEGYDVLYLDLDSDGDLTRPRERFTGKLVDEDHGIGHAVDGALEFEIGDFSPRGSKLSHKEFTIVWMPPNCVVFELRWRGRERTAGGIGRTADEQLAFSTSSAKAPILIPGCDRPLQFQRRGDEPLTRKHVEDLVISAGIPGSGVASFSALDARSFDPKEILVATLVYRDSSDRMQEERFEWRNLC